MPRRDFETDEENYLKDIEKYCDTVLLARADESDSGEFFPDVIRQFADLGLLELMFDEDRNLQLHRMRLIHRTTELVAAAFPASVVALGALRLQAYLLKRYAAPHVADRYLDGRAGVDHLGAAHHAVGGLHRDGTHDVVADVLLDFQRQRPRRVGVDRDIDVQREVDLRHLIRRELHVYDGADDPRDAAGAGDGVAALGCLLIGRGHMFLTHSLHSRRPARWRRRRSR